MAVERTRIRILDPRVSGARRQAFCEAARMHFAHSVSSFEKMACVTWASVVNLAESCRHVFAVDRSPPRASTCPVVGFGGVREHRCENRLARAGFLPGWGRCHPGAPVLRLDQHAS